MTDQTETYTFTERERAYFERYRMQLNALLGELNHAIHFVCVQQGLEGAWQMRPDGSGLEPANLPAPAPAPIPEPKPNGVSADA